MSHGTVTFVILPLSSIHATASQRPARSGGVPRTVVSCTTGAAAAGAAGAVGAADVLVVAGSSARAEPRSASTTQQATTNPRMGRRV